MGSEMCIRDSYQGYSKDSQLSNTLLEQVAEMISISANNNCGIQRIISFNFDDLLERSLKAKKLRVTPVYKPSPVNNQDILIYHPHGYLPRNSPIPEHDIVFTEEEFNALTLNPFSWATNEVANSVRSSTGLFLGLSMTDPNLRRVLDACSKEPETPKQFVLRKRYTKELRNEDDDIKLIQNEAVVEARRRKLTRHEKSSLDVRRAISKVTRQAERYEQSFFEQLGVEIVWVSRFSDMPKVIKPVSYTHLTLPTICSV